MAQPETVGGAAAGAVATRIPTSAAGAWEDALADVPHTFAHTRAWCEAMARASGSPTFLLRLETSSGPCVGPLQERTGRGRRDLVSPYGIAGFAGAVDAPDLPAMWHAWASENGYVCAYVALHPVSGAERGEWAGLVTAERPLHLLRL